MLKIHEIFNSINGETTDAGKPCTFIRLYGCNVKCSYCDQPQRASDYTRMSVQNIMSQVRRFKRTKNICITGGEPLVQDIEPLLYDLVNGGYNVSIETNGCIPIEADYYRRSYKYIMDIKCPSSNIPKNKICFQNLRNLHSHDEVKFVIKDEEDYKFARNTLRNYPTRAKILFSPMFDKNLNHLIGGELVDWVCRDFDTKDTDVRIQLQIHKFLEVR